MTALLLTFLTATLFPASAADVELFVVVKGQSFVQYNSAVCFLSSDEPLGFNCFLIPTTTNAVTQATLSKPSGEVVPLEPLSEPELYDSFKYLPDLDTAYPSGTYRLTLNTVNDGLQVVDLPLTGDAYPNPPFILNFDAAQQIDTASPFTLEWSDFVGGVEEDYVQLSVEDNNWDTVFETPEPGQAGALNGTSTSATLPAGLLAPGKTYHVRVLFAKITHWDITSYLGSIGIAAYYKETDLPITAAGIDSTTFPGLESSSPANYEGGVERNSVVAFHFDKPMDSGYAIAWSANVMSEHFTCTWSQDQRKLFCLYSELLPDNATIEWTLNPVGSLNGFQDLAGQPLGSLSGQFSTLGETPAGTDVEAIYVGKAREYRQTNATPFSLEHYLAGFIVEFTGFNTVTSNQLSLPNGRRMEVPPDEDENEVEGIVFYASAEDLNAFFPDGHYTATVAAVRDGTRFVSLNLSDGLYPNVPAILNWPATQVVDASQPFTLSWAPFAGGKSSDMMYLEIFNDLGNTVYESGDGTTNLDGASTSIVLPASSLGPGRQYEVWLEFGKIVDTDPTSYPGITTGAFYLSRTQFMLRTTGAPRGPTLEVWYPVPDVFGVSVRGESGRNYTLEWNTNPADPGGWVPFYQGTTLGDGRFNYWDIESRWAPYRFYRAREGW